MSGAEAKRQLNGKLILPKTSIADRSVVLAIQQYNICNYPDPTPSTTDLRNLAQTSILLEGIPLRTFCLDPPSGPQGTNPPIPVPLNPDLLVLSQSALTPLPNPSSVPDSVNFGLGIEEALPYAAMAQATYRSPVATTMDELADTSKEIARELHSTPSLLAFLASKQRKTLGTLPEVVRHPAAALLHSYSEEVIQVHT